ncbi:hypothetical protein A2U01_0059360, partial [Trifolium medium]|nr:hypothetical protein [Trifolium medium]
MEVGGGSQPSSPQPKGSRALRNRPTIPAKIVNEETVIQGEISGVQNDDVATVVEIVAKDAQAIKDTVPPPAATAADGANKASAWEKSFDPIAFVERNLIMKGDSS